MMHLTNHGRTKVKKKTTVIAACVAVAFAGTASAAYAGIENTVFGHTRVRSSIPEHTPRFQISSPQLANGFPASAWWNSFGCTGANQAPSFSWSGAPAATKSYAVTLFDKDAATGSGFWHMVDFDIPATTTSFGGALPAGAVEAMNDAGDVGYMGPCPPAGDIAHHYQLRVLALDVPTLGLPTGMPPALTSYIMSSHVIGQAEMTVIAQR
jgi:Raf kinase inhibitor-like YbhB/YbcL family protein